MSNRHHLPAGQNIQGAGGMPNVDMTGAPGAPGGGPRRRGPPGQYMPPYHPQQHQHQPQPQPPHHQMHAQQVQQMNPMYQNYNPYAPPQYYGMPPQFQNGGMPSPAYMPYQGYGRSPPSMHQYVPMAGVSVPQNYSRHHQQSPSLSTPYQPPQAAGPMPPIPPHTPSSTHSSQIQPPPTPPTPQTREPVHTAPVPQPQVVLPETPRGPFRPPLPWLSRPDLDFPARTSRLKRCRQRLDANSQPVSLPTDQQAAAIEEPKAEGAIDVSTVKATDAEVAEPQPAQDGATDAQAGTADAVLAEPAPIPRQPPTSWANLFARTSAAPSANGTASVGVNGSSNADSGPSSVIGSAFAKANTNSLAEAIRSYRVGGAEKHIVFLEPRGLINTGNMCYMNSVLQVLMFCSPFYEFLDQVSKRAVHSFKSDTPLLDAMVMFMHEYKVIKSASSDEQLRKIVRSEEIDRYGEPFTPEFVYEAIRQLSRFASMRRGHQQDAEEFLGFLLQSLDDECNIVINNASQTASQVATSETASVDDAADPTGDWLEVGRKQRAAVTRSSGSNLSTPITKIFGGLLRSEFRVPGLKDSITTEPYQPLQLDIGSPDVRNVVDALRGLTRPERLQGNFNSPRGKDIVATKQVFIETLPPVLILHLKRFQFDAEGGTIKIWKNIGYPLELEIPREALSRQARQTMGTSGMPKYRLISVVYHHGKNASGGHYTVDVRRQDGREWLRLDDTVLRRVPSDEVASSGADVPAKDTRKEPAAAPAAPPANRFGAMEDEDSGDEDGWKQVTTSPGSSKRWSSVVNGSPNGAGKDKYIKENIKDNKVAYLLFYQRV